MEVWRREFVLIFRPLLKAYAEHLEICKACQWQRKTGCYDDGCADGQSLRIAAMWETATIFSVESGVRWIEVDIYAG